MAPHESWPVPYKLTLKRPKTVEARHIEQSGGLARFAVVRVRFRIDPAVEELEFVDMVENDSVPREYVPAVAAGIAAAIRVGDRGFPYCKIVAELYDGESHSVDSSAMAFEAAGSRAFRLAAENNSLLLEAIMKVEIAAPEEKTGEVIGDLSSRRGIIEELICKPGGVTVITGKVPLAEMAQYSNTLRSLTQDRATCSMRLASYEPAPPGHRKG